MTGNNIWDNNKDSVKGVLRSVGKYTHNGGQFIAKTGYNITKQHSGKPKESDDTKEKLHIYNTTTESSQLTDPSQFPPPPLKPNQKQYRPGGLIVDGSTISTTIQNIKTHVSYTNQEDDVSSQKNFNYDNSYPLYDQITPNKGTISQVQPLLPPRSRSTHVKDHPQMDKRPDEVKNYISNTENYRSPIYEPTQSLLDPHISNQPQGPQPKIPIRNYQSKTHFELYVGESSNKDLKISLNNSDVTSNSIVPSILENSTKLLDNSNHSQTMIFDQLKDVPSDKGLNGQNNSFGMNSKNKLSWNNIKPYDNLSFSSDPNSIIKSETNTHRSASISNSIYTPHISNLKPKPHSDKNNVSSNKPPILGEYDCNIQIDYLPPPKPFRKNVKTEVLNSNMLSPKNSSKEKSNLKIQTSNMSETVDTLQLNSVNSFLIPPVSKVVDIQTKTPPQYSESVSSKLISTDELNNKFTELHLKKAKKKPPPIPKKKDALKLPPPLPQKKHTLNYIKVGAQDVPKVKLDTVNSQRMEDINYSTRAPNNIGDPIDENPFNTYLQNVVPHKTDRISRR